MKGDKKIVLWTFVVILLTLNVVFILKIFIPFVKDKTREKRILKDMSSVYKNARFLDVQCDNTPFDKDVLEKKFIWLGDGIPDEDLYAFIIYDSNDKTGIGYADKNGNVVFDEYAGVYYREDIIQYFKDAVDYDRNFPGIHYFIPNIDPINDNRFVVTHECYTFENYRKSSTVGFHFMGSGGYPGIFLGLEKTDKETITKMNDLLTDAEFDMYVTYNKISGDFDNAKETLDLNWDDPDYEHTYYPFGETYDKAILGND